MSVTYVKGKVEGHAGREAVRFLSKKVINAKKKRSGRFKRVSTITLNKVIEDFSQLPLDDKEYAISIIKKQLIEAKREVIAKRAKEAMANLKRGMVKKGTVKELLKDLEGD